jgi:phosphopantothenoylcysteine decarboxylase / phosphopantothenate---cysteine ligase
MTRGEAASALAGRRILLGVSGGIAAYKAAYLARLLVDAGADVVVVMTPSATRFVGPDTFAALTRNAVQSDIFEATDQVLHVRLGRSADVAVVAPATANLLAQLAVGLAGDLLTATLLESSCPLVLAPAMHSGMWGHPATVENVRKLLERGAAVVGPDEGALAAGDEGPGRMAEPAEILRAVEAAVGGRPSPAELAGRTVLVTAGPTHEPIDSLRYIGNRSSGKMGFAVAAELVRRGATVTLVAGPVSLADPPGVEVVRVETAEEMSQRVLERFPSVDAVVMAAAVADFRPVQPVTGKLKKEAGIPDVAMERTPDILATLGKRKERQVLVGFAAETADVEAEGRRKLAEKNVDLMVANEVGRSGTGFGSDTDRAALLTRSGEDTPLGEWTKKDLAVAIADRIVALTTPMEPEDRDGGSDPV